VVMNPPLRRVLRAYGDILIEWNRRINLTSRKRSHQEIHEDINSCVHVLPTLDSAAVATAQARVIDIGSGAGLPGVVIAAARPQWDVVLLEATGKKCDFLQAVVKHLDLHNCSVENARAEEYAHRTAGSGYAARESFDIAVGRAVAEMRVFAEMSLPFVKLGGSVVAIKGPKAEEELNAAQGALPILGGELGLLEGTGAQTLLTLSKVQPTPLEYPRAWNLIKARAL